MHGRARGELNLDISDHRSSRFQIRPILVNLSQPTAGPSRRLPPPGPNSKASSSNSGLLKRVRGSEGSRSQSPVKMPRTENGIDSIDVSDEEDELEEEMSVHGPYTRAALSKVTHS